MKHLTTRLVLLVMLAFLVITGAFDYVRLARERDRLVAVAATDQRVFAETLALAVRRNVRRGRTTEELQELLEEIRQRPGLVWAAIYDPKGEVVAAATAWDVPAPPPADHTVTLALKRRESRSGLAEESGGKVLRHIQPFRWPDGRTAAVEVRQRLDAVEREFAHAVRERIVYRLVVLVLFVLAILAVTRWSIARPMRALTQGARAVASGDLSQRIDVRRADELGQLAEEFNRMAQSLEQAQQALLEQSEARLRLERDVQQAQKLVAVGMLAAEVAHEIGTPLNVISGRAEALARGIPADDPERRHLDVISSQTERITAIVRDLLDYARPRRPQLRAEQPGPILARVTDLLAGRRRDKGVGIRLELPPEEVQVLADADHLQQVFVNLLTNALDASPPGGTVRVTHGPESLLPPEGRASVLRGKADTPLVAIHVLDEGKGMGEEELAQAFQPFFSTKRRGHGTGLGLPIVEEIVRAHRGEVEILSVADRGTEVIVRLPVLDPQAREPADGTAAEAPPPERPAREA